MAGSDAVRWPAVLSATELSNSFLAGLLEICFVTADHRRTMEGLVRLGIGPWRIYTFDSRTVSERTYRGAPADFGIKVCFATTGELAVEIMQPRVTHLRRAALGLGVAAIALSNPGAVAVGMSPLRPYVAAEADARYQPTLRNDQGVKAPHICPQRGYYFDEQGNRHPTGGACTRQYAPLTVRPGEWLSLRTARAAKRVVITPFDSPANSFEGGRACHRRYSGVWRCRTSAAFAADHSLRISIAYPKARGNWSADIRVSGLQ